MSNTVRFKTKKTGIEKAPNRMMKVCEKTLRKTMELATQKAEDKAPKRTGRLKGEKGGGAGIRYDVKVSGKKITGILSATSLNPITGEDYSLWVHEGTGVHGPAKKPIKPKKGKLLVWLKDGRPNPTTDAGWQAEHEAKNVVFAKEVQGQEPQPFLADGLDEAFKKTPAIFDAEMRQFNNQVV